MLFLIALVSSLLLLFTFLTIGIIFELIFLFMIILFLFAGPLLFFDVFLSQSFFIVLLGIELLLFGFLIFKRKR